MGKRLVYSARSNNSSSPLTIGELAAAGAFSAVPATLVAGPAERIKVLLQVRRIDLNADMRASLLIWARRSQDKVVTHLTLVQWMFFENYTQKEV